MVLSTDPSPVIRPATVQDGDAIAVVQIRCWQQTYAALVPSGALDHLDPVRQAERWRAIIADPAASIVVATVDGVVVGWAGTSTGRDPDAPRPLELEALYVLAEHLGTGIGQALLHAAVGDAPACLWVADPNPRAEAFYRRNGFTRDGARKEHPLAGHPVPAVRMVR